MKYNPDKHHRKSIRLKGYDYSQPGWYFVTICTQNHELLFGYIKNGKMVLNDPGIMIKNIWNEIPQFYHGIDIGIHQIMPNHLHGIINITNVATDPCVCPDFGQSLGLAPTISLPEVVQRFKSLTTKHYIGGVKQYNWCRFNKKLWQRNYYEHVIRDEKDLNRIQQYIIENPLKWQDDRYFKKYPN